MRLKQLVQLFQASTDESASRCARCMTQTVSRPHTDYPGLLVQRCPACDFRVWWWRSSDRVVTPRPAPRSTVMRAAFQDLHQRRPNRATHVHQSRRAYGHRQF